MGLDLKQAMSCLPVLAAVAEARADELERSMRLTHLPPGDNLFVEDDAPSSFDFLVSGWLKLVRYTGGGSATIIDLVLPGGVVCGNCPLANVSFCCTSIAGREGAEIASISKDAMLRWLTTIPSVRERFFETIVQSNKHRCARVAEIGSGSAVQRVAALLLHLAEEIGRRAGARSLVPVLLPRQDIASLCALSPETASRVMSSFERKGWICAHEEGILLLDKTSMRGLLLQPQRRLHTLR